MIETVWTLPVTSTGLDYEADFQMLAGRACSLTCGYAIDDNRAVKLNLLFDGVEAFKCTHYHACTLDMIEAYDEVVDRGSTEWLGSIRERLSRYDENVSKLRHLMIYFDDGPCYEFICKEFRVAETTVGKEIFRNNLTS